MKEEEIKFSFKPSAHELYDVVCTPTAKTNYGKATYACIITSPYKSNVKRTVTIIAKSLNDLRAQLIDYLNKPKENDLAGLF